MTDGNNGREAGRVAIAEMCAAFEDNIAYYKSAEYDETTTRQRFIDKFFVALGWDVTDDAKRGPFADVILETRLPRGAASPFDTWDEEDENERVAAAVAAKEGLLTVGLRRPDYSFRINGERQFFVEAKRPAVNINSPRPIFQVKSYAWSAGTPLAVLTDFEEFLVFDCRYRPELDKPLVGLLPEFRLGFRDYAEKWDLLWDTFSREAVAAGSLLRYAESVEDARGQLPVDRAFLGDLGVVPEHVGSVHPGRLGG